jgi:hypothetical protein
MQFFIMHSDSYQLSATELPADNAALRKICPTESLATGKLTKRVINVKKEN